MINMNLILPPLYHSIKVGGPQTRLQLFSALLTTKPLGSSVVPFVYIIMQILVFYLEESS